MADPRSLDRNEIKTRLEDALSNVRDSPGSLTMLISLLGSWASLCKEILPTLDQPVGWFGDREEICPTGLIYMLDHRYRRTELYERARLNLTDRLTGADRDRVAELRKACDSTGFSLFLVDIRKSHTGPVDDFGDYIEESSLVLSRVVEPEGLTFAEGVDIDDDVDAIFVQEDPFDDPDEEDYSGGTGSEEGTVTHLYRRTVKKKSSPLLPSASK